MSCLPTLLSLSILFSRFTHFVTGITSSFIFTDKYYSVVRTYPLFCFLIHKLVNGNLGCFYSLALMNNTAMNIHAFMYRFLYERLF